MMKLVTVVGCLVGLAYGDPHFQFIGPTIAISLSNYDKYNQAVCPREEGGYLLLS